MIQKLYAEVRMTNVFQLEFEADPNWSVSEIDEAAKKQALKLFGVYDEVEVGDFDHSPIRKEEGE